MLRVLFDFVVNTSSNPLGAGISDPAPLQKTRRNGAPTVLVMPARSKPWATCPLRLHGRHYCSALQSAPVHQRALAVEHDLEQLIEVGVHELLRNSYPAGDPLAPTLPNPLLLGIVVCLEHRDALLHGLGHEVPQDFGCGLPLRSRPQRASSL
jgi:hypothetical protein